MAPTNFENFVEVPEVSIPLSNEQLEELKQHIAPLDDDGNHGCNLYMETLHMIRNFLQVQY